MRWERDKMKTPAQFGPIYPVVETAAIGLKCFLRKKDSDKYLSE